MRETRSPARPICHELLVIDYQSLLSRSLDRVTTLRHRCDTGCYLRAANIIHSSIYDSNTTFDLMCSVTFI